MSLLSKKYLTNRVVIPLNLTVRYAKIVIKCWMQKIYICHFLKWTLINMQMSNLTLFKLEKPLGQLIS